MIARQLENDEGEGMVMHVFVSCLTCLLDEEIRHELCTNMRLLIVQGELCIVLVRVSLFFASVLYKMPR